MSLNYDRAEVEALVVQLRRMRGEDAPDAEDAPTCPRCGAAMTIREVFPREEVAYVRHRLWLTCPSCRRNAVVDRRDLER